MRGRAAALAALAAGLILAGGVRAETAVSLACEAKWREGARRSDTALAETYGIDVERHMVRTAQRALPFDERGDEIVFSAPDGSRVFIDRVFLHYVVWVPGEGGVDIFMGGCQKISRPVRQF